MSALPGALERGLRRIAGALGLRRHRAAADDERYAAWLARRIRARGRRFPIPGAPATFSLLTTVYRGTDAMLLQQTAHSVLAQGLAPCEWIVLAHGPIGDALDRSLRELSGQGTIKLERVAHELGIVPAMRRCLEAARGDYAVPLDADDLLTPDALQVLAATIAAHGAPEHLYSDEDAFLEGAPARPYWRPDWDPVLNLDNSYVWHLCAFRRARALELGVYGDEGTNWCHDWDTVTRFANAGHTPLHVREVLYHWRQHAASSTHRAGPNPESLRSTHHLLERERLRRDDPARFELRHFPIDRGVPEWHIARRRSAPRAADLVLIVTDPGSALLALGALERRFDYRPESVALCAPLDFSPRRLAALEQFARTLCAAGGPGVRVIEGNDPAAIGTALRAAAAPLVWLFSDAARVEDGEAPWEALRLMELHPQVRLACGRLIDRAGRIVDSGGTLGAAGEAIASFRGMAAADPGPYALALKPHAVEVATPDFLFAERAFLADAFGNLPLTASRSGLALWLAGAALAAGVRTAYSPLIRARALGPLACANCGADELRAILGRFGTQLDARRLSTSHHAEMERQYSRL